MTELERLRTLEATLTELEGNTKKIFAARLREARKAKGLTQAQIAAKIGISQGSYAQYENMKREPSLQTLAWLSKILERSIDWLLGLVIVEESDYRQVKPESIAQLVGIDSNGKEVYEGDEVVDKFGEKYLAQLTPTFRENYEGAGGVFSKPTERFWAERRQYMPLTLVEQCT